MSKFRDCPVENESPDPCPKCGATVSGKDAVNGVCQAGATWDRATAAERERCAQVAERYLSATTESKRFGPEVARAIRRTEAPTPRNPKDRIFHGQVARGSWSTP